MIGVADHPGRTVADAPRDDPVRHPEAVGDERGAYGYLANGRVVVTLDRPGHEAWAAIVNDKTGLAGMSLLFPPGLGKGVPR